MFIVCHRHREDEDAEKIVNKHIKLLHEYNEAKDATQVCPQLRIYLSSSSCV